MNTLPDHISRMIPFFAFLFGTATMAQQPLLVTISKETTRIVEPLKENGYPDYVAALNQHLGHGVTADNNIAVAVWEMVGPGELLPEIRSLYFQHLRMAPLPKDGNYYHSFHQHIEERLTELGQDPNITSSEVNARREKLERQYDYCISNPWNKESSREMDLWLASAKPFLDRFIQAVEERDHCFHPYVVSSTDRTQPTPELISILLPGAVHTREIARGLALLANRHLAEGQMDDAVRISRVIHRLGRISSTGGTLVEGLVGIAVDQFGFDLDRRLIASSEMPKASLIKLQAQLEHLPPISSLSDKISLTERYMYLETAITLARHGPHVLSQVTDGFSEASAAEQNPVLSGLANIVTGSLVDWDSVLKTGNYWYDEIGRINRIDSIPKRAIENKKLEDRLIALREEVGNPATIAKQILFSGKSIPELTSRQMSNILVSLLLPSIQAAVSAEIRNRARMSITRTACALKLYHHDNNRYPDSLAALTGVYIDKLPMDPFRDKSMTYRTQTAGFLLYSIGPNMKDDGGKDYEQAPDADDIVFTISPQ